VHCIYKTANTELGKVTGSKNTGATATLDVESKNIPRLTTVPVCSEKAIWDAHYKVTAPDSLFVD